MYERKLTGNNHTLIAIFEHASSIKEQNESREIGENRVGETHGRNGTELLKPTRESRFLCQLVNRETSTRIPARNDPQPVKKDS